MNTVLPLLGAAAIALVALIAAALMLRRRRKRRLEADEAVYIEDAPAAELRPEPSFAPAVAPAAPVVAPVHDPIFDQAPSKAPTTTLPAGFDLSRFGRHTQAAYRGPTPDNPSLSLKYRLRKAAALDQRERMNRAQPVAESAAVTAAAARAEVAPAGGEFMLGKDRTKATVRRAYSH